MTEPSHFQSHCTRRVWRSYFPRSSSKLRIALLETSLKSEWLRTQMSIASESSGENEENTSIGTAWRTKNNGYAWYELKSPNGLIFKLALFPAWLILNTWKKRLARSLVILTIDGRLRSSAVCGFAVSCLSSKLQTKQSASLSLILSYLHCTNFDNYRLSLWLFA